MLTTNKTLSRVFEVTGAVATAFLLAVATVYLFGGKPKPALVFDYWTDTPGNVKLYFDRGNGLNESDSSHMFVSKREVWQEIRLELAPAKIRTLRLDPLDRAGRVALKNVRIFKPDLTVHPIPLSAFRPERHIRSSEERDGQLDIETVPDASDPILAVTLQGELDLRSRVSLASVLAWALVWGMAIIILYCGPRLPRERPILKISLLIAKGCVGLIKSIRSRPWIALICFIVLSGPLVIRTNHSVKQADRWANVDVYYRVDHWILSSECTVKTGAILAICSPNGKAGAIEDVGLADDRGHTLIANLYSLVTGRVIDRKGLTVVNIALNALAFYGLVCAFFIYGWQGTALLLLIFGSRMAVPGPLPSADSNAAHIAAFCLAMIAVLWIAHAPLTRAKNSTIRFFVGLIVATFCLAWSTLLRQPYGLGGFLVVVLILAVRLFMLGRHHGFEVTARTVSWRSATAIICLAVAAFYSTSALIKVREIVYGVPRGERIIQHGISHNLYLGLGVENNPWGIKWNDGYGYESATRIGKADYASEEHYANLWRLYFNIVLSDPIAVLKIYAGKLGSSLLVAAGDDSRKLTKGGVAILILLTILIWSRRSPKGDEMIVALGTWAGFGTVMLQGVLALPAGGFISPGKLGALCGIVVLVEAVGRSVAVRLQEKARAIAIS